MFQPGHTPAHAGRTTTTDPIKTLDALQAVKAQATTVRDKALLAVALNSALRAGDLCNLRWDDTQDDGTVITLKVLEGKTKKPRQIPLNPDASSALRAWRRECDCEYIYSGIRGRLTTATWGRMVKAWCKEAGLEGRFSGHTTRKSFVRIQHDEFGTSLVTLMKMLNHSNPIQTLIYMGRMEDDVLKAYSHAL